MAKYTKSEVKKKLEELKDVFNQLVEEQSEEISNFINKEIIPHAAGMSEFMKNHNPLDNPHPKYGHNPHPLSCGRCGRPTPVVLPMGRINAVWSCKPCGAEMYGIEDDFVKCPGCNQIMTQEKVFKPQEPISFDYRCKVCREHEESQVKIATEGGALIVCPRCSTSGTLPATDKQVMRFRSEKGIGNKSEVRFILSETQCPRCADMMVQRVFTENEANRILLHNADVEEGFYKEAILDGSKTEGKPNVKKHKKSVNVVGNTGTAKVEVPSTKKEVFIHHPGTKSFN